MWDDQFGVFAERFRTVRYDRRGFGRSGAASGPFSHRRDLYELLRLLGIGKTHLLGSSMGGATAIDFALEHPGMTDSLVLVSSALGGYRFAGEMPKPLEELAGSIKRKR